MASHRAPECGVGLIASSQHLVPDERFDLLVHALAQLPDDVVLQVFGDGPAKRSIEVLARAYGVDDRLVFSADIPKSVDGLIVHPSQRNRRSAPIRSNISGSSVALETRASGRDPGVFGTLGELVHAIAGDCPRPASLRSSRDEVLRGSRVAILTNVPVHYRIPLFAAVARRIEGVGATFKVFFLASKSKGRAWLGLHGDVDFEWEVLRSVPLSRRSRPPLLPVNLELQLAKFAPTTMLVGGFSPVVSPRAFLYARRAGSALGLWSGDISSSTSARSLVRRRERRWLAQRAGFGLSYGSLSAEYLRGLSGALPVIFGRNTSGLSAPAERPRNRVPVELLTVGDLSTDVKGVDILVDSLRLLPDLECRLTVVGGGALLGDLRRRAAGDPRIRFMGPTLPEDTANAYRNADGFLFPSRGDIFGLALVEAMDSGLSVIAASTAGAVPDVCVPERTALVVADHRPESWAAAIRRLVEDSALRRSLGAAARLTIERRWTIDHSADAFVAALRLAVLTSGRQAGAETHGN